MSNKLIPLVCPQCGSGLPPGNIRQNIAVCKHCGIAILIESPYVSTTEFERQLVPEQAVVKTFEIPKTPLYWLHGILIWFPIAFVGAFIDVYNQDQFCIGPANILGLILAYLYVRHKRRNFREKFLDKLKDE